jgi:hypothetical protein
VDEPGVEILFDLEDGVDGFGRDVEAGGVREEEWGVEAVVDGDVDLAAAAAVGVDDKGAGGAVTLGEIACEEVEPVLLGDGAAGGGLLEELAGGEVGEHLSLHVEEEVAEAHAAGVGRAGHNTKTKNKAKVKRQKSKGKN